MDENTVLHDVIIEGRKKLTASGIVDVDSYEENCIIAKSECGEMTICGNGLKISRLSVESGDMMIEGNIDSVAYGQIKQGSFLSRVFR